ncbi:hypothetical protein IW261DRAFT_722631 [Armillaria novae-zelandiae]|uniref:Uncharacterized protein n=1 Tax=Armillaria novae-zelandiae TaxID=153914 RepID=A0AA39NWX7_9AGAR|nr:hypothetical protein IW261DRAFT_722631 [Armillaria novae-zelandiae]
MRAYECLNRRERLCFCFATSIGFKFGPVTENATVDKPFSLTWILDKDDDPDKLYLQQRLISQNSGYGTNITFFFPNNGTLNGTVTVTFEVSGDHLAEAFRDDQKSPIGSSNTISVGNKTSSSTAYPTPVSSSSATSYTVTSVSSTSPSSSGGQGIPSTRYLCFSLNS